MAPRRIVVKVGSSSLTSTDSDGATGIDDASVDALADAVADARDCGDEVVVVSSGAIAAGLAPLGLRRRPRDLATQQAAASAGQGLLVRRWSERLNRRGYPVGQVLLTVDDVTRRGHYRNAYRTFARLLELGAVPVVNENDTVATSEIRFGDNDRLAALVAHLVHADLLVLLSDVEGLYSGDPRDAASHLIREVHSGADLDAVDIARPSKTGLGTGGMVTKLESARIATGAGIAVVLTSAGRAAEALAPAAGREPGPGTLFHPTGRRRPTRLLWLAHATQSMGTLTLDAGAVRAVVDRRASLLPAGVVLVSGTFSAGDPVDLADEQGHPVARGLVNYDSVELPRLLGRSTVDLAREEGPGYERELVHRDDLVLLH
jgi:glutamate 5-kinase